MKALGGSRRADADEACGAGARRRGRGAEGEDRDGESADKGGFYPLDLA